MIAGRASWTQRTFILLLIASHTLTVHAQIPAKGGPCFGQGCKGQERTGELKNIESLSDFGSQLQVESLSKIIEDIDRANLRDQKHYHDGNSVAILEPTARIRADGISEPKDEPNVRSKGVPILAGLGGLELCLGALTLAAGAGLISQAEKERLTSQIEALVHDSARQLKELNIKQMIEVSVAIVDLQIEISTLLKKARDKAKECIKPEAKPIAKTCQGDWRSCCSDLTQFLQKKYTVERQSNWIKIFGKAGRAAKDLLCCFEADLTHGLRGDHHFEIFDRRGTHIGERYCTDLGDDPCQFTTSLTKAKPRPHDHKPRTGCGQ